MLSLVSSFSCGSREGSRCSLCVAHSNFGPKRASNSGRIYSSNKINIQSCPLDLARRLAFSKEGDRLGGRGKWECCAEAIPSSVPAPVVM